MFYIQSVFDLTVIFWFSALLAELVFVSPAERALHPGMRAGLGYILSVVWFSAAFKLMPIEWAWVVGLFLLFVYVGMRSKAELEGLLLQIKTSGKAYVNTFLWYVLGAALFLLPLHIGQNYGPFTEGGGDITIYTDVGKYLTDHHLPAYGISDVIHDVERLVENPAVGFTDNDESVATFDQTRGNPPVADHGEYRNAIVQRWPSGWFVPTSQWFFLKGDTNYPIYFAVLGFQYACILFSIWGFFRRFGRVPAMIAAVLVASSHGLISVYYNHYFPQSIALMVGALIVGLLPTVRVFSLAGLRTYGLSVAVVSTGHLYFLSTLIPLLFIPLKNWLHAPAKEVSANLSRMDGQGVSATDDVPANSSRGTIRKKLLGLVRHFSVLAFAVVVLTWAVVDTFANLGVYVPFIKNVYAWLAQLGPLVSERSLYLGDPIPKFSPQWLSFFFGILSQQHFEPLMHVPPLVNSVLPWSVYSGVSVLLLSLGISVVFFWMVLRGRIADTETRRVVVFSLVVYVVSLVVVGSHHLIAQSSLYTQAKGAQNVLVVLYVSMVIPLGVAYKLYHGGERKKWLKIVGWGYGVVLGVFAMSLLVLRLIYALMIAFGLGRSSILEPSYFSRAEEILRQDKDAFVLVEPRISADTYLGIQPFAGARMIPTRYLAQKTIQNVYTEGKWSGVRGGLDVLPSDFIRLGNLLHLWHLTAKKIGTKKFVEGIEGGEYDWVAERLVEVKEPRLLMFGQDYEAFYGERLRSSKNDDKGWFTFFRNGSAMMVMPAHASTSVLEVKVQPRDGVKFAEMVKEVRAGVERATGEWSVRTDTSDAMLTVRYELPAAGEARLVPLVRYWGEFWMNVRVDDKELKTPGVTVKGEITVSPDTVQAGQSLTAIWSEVSPSNSDDWIGVFPVGGGDDTRVTFAFTSGGAMGSMQLTIPATAAAGKYELRLYSHGGWQKIASSKPFVIVR